MTPEEENKKLKSVLRSMLSWANSSACGDCTPFREAPSCIDWIHEKDCGHLETMNEAFALLGYPPEDGHTFEDPEGRMRQLAAERYTDCKLRGLIK